MQGITKKNKAIVEFEKEKHTEAFNYFRKSF